MRCPFCGCDDTQVKDSRSAEENAAVRRRRLCVKCGGRFSTMERVHLRELVVVKSNGDKVAFDRDKLYRSMRTAVRKRDISDDTVESMSNSIVRRLESIGEVEINSKIIGEMVMEALRQIDMVAYIRFASVYREFEEVSDFEDILADVAKDRDD